MAREVTPISATATLWVTVVAVAEWHHLVSPAPLSFLASRMRLYS